MQYKCSRCNGTGRIEPKIRDSLHSTLTCFACHGRGNRTQICKVCGDQGFGIVPESYERVFDGSKKTIFICVCHQLARIEK